MGDIRRGLDADGFGDVHVVGNGGVRTWEDVGRLTREQDVQGWMVGEELSSNPRSGLSLSLAFRLSFGSLA